MFGCIVSEVLLGIWFWQPPDITSSVDLHFVCFVCIDGINATSSCFYLILTSARLRPEKRSLRTFRRVSFCLFLVSGCLLKHLKRRLFILVKWIYR